MKYLLNCLQFKVYKEKNYNGNNLKSIFLFCLIWSRSKYCSGCHKAKVDDKLSISHRSCFAFIKHLKYRTIQNTDVVNSELDPDMNYSWKADWSKYFRLIMILKYYPFRPLLNFDNEGSACSVLWFLFYLYNTLGLNLRRSLDGQVVSAMTEW